MAKKDRPEPSRGIAAPSNLRDHLEAIDAAVFELAAVRTGLMNQVQDDFTVLGSSAQIFREILFGVELPIDSPQTLIKRAGGPLRLIEISYREFGNKLFALGDVIAAIPKFRECFPIKDFAALAAKLHDIKRSGPDVPASWFVPNITNKRLAEALAQEQRALITGKIRQSVLTRARTKVVAACCCGGAAQSPAKLIATALADLVCAPSATRWTGRSDGKPQSNQPPKAQPAKTTGRRK